MTTATNIIAAKNQAKAFRASVKSISASDMFGTIEARRCYCVALSAAQGFGVTINDFKFMVKQEVNRGMNTRRGFGSCQDKTVRLYDWVTATANVLDHVQLDFELSAA